MTDGLVHETKRSDENERRLAASLSRMSAALEFALTNDYRAVVLADDEAELRRQAAISSRRSQRGAQERAIQGLALKFTDHREDRGLLRDDMDALQRRVYLLDQEIEDLIASISMNFPSASQVANVSAAVGVLEARVAASAAAAAIMRAATDVIAAWSR